MKTSVLIVLVAVLSVTQLLAQTKTITGKVTDDKGNPIPNASITVKNFKSGISSNVDGSFTIEVPSSARIFVVSAVGFATTEVAITNQTTITVILKVEETDLGNVTVSYQAQSRNKTVIGATSKISGQAVQNKAVTSFDQSLTSKVAGVQVNTSSGLVGDNVIIRIRGASSISSGSQPLIVIDGVPVQQGNVGQLYNPSNALQDINPNDIESIDVLKDASAAALYGSRASAGVILITTKKGKAGAPKVTYDGYIGFVTPAKVLSVLNADQYNTIMNTLSKNAGGGIVAGYGDINGDGKPDIVNTDWQNQVYRTGIVHNHQVSMSGGTSKTSYYASANYFDYENYIIKNRLRRGSVRLNATTKAADWLTVGVNTQYTRGLQNGLGSGTSNASSGIPFGPFVMPPNLPVYGPNGEYYYGRGGDSTASPVPNPVAVLYKNFDNYETKRFLASGFAEAQIIQHLRLKTQYNIDYQTGLSDQFWNPDIGDGASKGLAQNVYNENPTWSWFSTLNYDQKFHDHTLNAFIGTEFTKYRSFYYYAEGKGLIDPQFTRLSSANYETTSSGGGIEENGLASYFGSINYSFKDKYSIVTNFRADAYSGFGKEHQFGYFPSVAIAWRASQEDFFKKLKSTITDLKLRLSYGTTGNSNIGSYPSLATYAPNRYGDLPALELNNPGNTALKWEKTRQLDIGFDASLFNKINLIFDYYRKNTSDLILNNPVLATEGFPNNSILQNIGKLKSEGIEFTINSTNINTKNFTWNTNFNITYNKNKVLSTNSVGDDVPSTYNVARPGEELGTYYLIKWAGVNQQNGNPMFYDKNGNIKMFDPTINKWKTLDNTVTKDISDEDRVLLKGKTPYPKFIGGFSNTLNYKLIDFTVDLQYAFEYYLYDNTMQFLSGYGNNRNKTIDILTAWTKPGDQTDYPKLDRRTVFTGLNSTRWLEKGDFVRIRNIEIGYSFPKELIDKLKLSKLRLYAQIQNAYTFTHYKGIDPEANNSGNVNIGLGIDRLRPYLPRTIVFGVNVGL